MILHVVPVLIRLELCWCTQSGECSTLQDRAIIAQAAIDGSGTAGTLFCLPLLGLDA